MTKQELAFRLFFRFRTIITLIIVSYCSFSLLQSALAQELQQNSISEQTSTAVLSKLEQALFFREFPDDDLPSRLARLEKQVFGTVMTSPIEQRLSKLTSALAKPPSNREKGTRVDTLVHEPSNQALVPSSLSSTSSIDNLTKEPQYQEQQFLDLDKMAAAALKENNYILALSHYQQMEKLAPNKAIVKYSIGSLYLMLKNPVAALEYYRQAQQLDPNNNEFASSYQELAQKLAKLPPSQTKPQESLLNTQPSQPGAKDVRAPSVSTDLSTDQRTTLRESLYLAQFFPPSNLGFQAATADPAISQLLSSNPATRQFVEIITKTPEFQDLLEKVQAVPWFKDITLVIDPSTKFADYNPNKSQITLKSFQDIPVAIHEFVHAFNQKLHIYYPNSDGANPSSTRAPIDKQTYIEQRLKDEVDAMMAELGAWLVLGRPGHLPLGNEDLSHMLVPLTSKASVENVTDIDIEQTRARIFNILTTLPVNHDSQGIPETYAQYYARTYGDWLAGFNASVDKVEAQGFLPQTERLSKSTE